MKNRSKKILSLILVGCIVITTGVYCAHADEDISTTVVATTEPVTENNVSVEEAQQMLTDQRKELEQKLAESEEKLKGYQDSAKETEEYINALDEKIGYLNEELNLLDSEIAQSQKKVKDYQKRVKALKKEMSALQKKYDKANGELKELQDSFDNTYETFCARMRAIYISGEDSAIAVLLTCDDIEQMLSRYEMIRSISKRDSELLKKLDSEMDKINTTKAELDIEKANLDAKSKELDKKQKDCEKEQAIIEQKQKELAEKKIVIAERRAESDALLAIYAEKSQQYGEYRNEDAELIAKVDAEIDSLLSGLKNPEEVTTAVATTNQNSQTSTTVSSTGALFSRSNAVLSMCYPVPSHHGVSASFGYYSNGKPHSGTDFPCPVGSKVVAAQKGIVINVQRLDYSYGYYVMVYHGTDAKGRKIVTLYAHNSSILVSVGQTVTKGQQIAKSGSTGNSTGPHSHFEVIIDGTKVNSKNYLG